METKTLGKNSENSSTGIEIYNVKHLLASIG